MKKQIFYFLPVIVGSVLFLNGCGLFKKADTPVERKEELSEPISVLLEKKQEFECFISGSMPVSRIMAKNNLIKIDGFSNKILKSKTGDGGTFLVNGDRVTFWEFKEGVSYDTKNLKDRANAGDKTSADILESLSASEWAKKVDKLGIKYTCKKASIPDEYFKIPSEVKITEFGEEKKESTSNQTEKKSTAPEVDSNKPSGEPNNMIIEDPEVENLQ